MKEKVYKKSFCKSGFHHNLNEIAGANMNQLKQKCGNEDTVVAPKINLHFNHEMYFNELNNRVMPNFAFIFSWKPSAGGLADSLSI